MPNSQPGAYKRHTSLLCLVSSPQSQNFQSSFHCCAAFSLSPFRRSVCTESRKSRPPKLCPHQRLCTRGVEGRSSFWGAHPCATARCCRTTTSWWRNCTANICTASTVDRLHRTGSTSDVG